MSSTNAGCPDPGNGENKNGDGSQCNFDRKVKVGLLELKEENELLRSSEASLKKELETLKALEVRFDSSEKAFRSSLDELTEEKMRMESRYRLLQECQGEVIDQKFLLEDELDEAKGEIARLQTLNEEEALKLSAMTQHDPAELESLKATNSSLEGKLKHSETLILALETTVKDHQQKLSDKTKIVNETQRHFESEIEGLRSKLKESSKLEEDLKTKFGIELKTRINEERIEVARIKNVMIEEVNAKLKVQTEELKRGTLTLTQMERSKNSEISVLRDEIKSRDKVIADLKSQLIVLHNEKEIHASVSAKEQRGTQTEIGLSSALTGSRQSVATLGSDSISEEWKISVQEQLDSLNDKFKALSSKQFHKVQQKNSAFKPFKSNLNSNAFQKQLPSSASSHNTNKASNKLNFDAQMTMNSSPRDEGYLNSRSQKPPPHPPVNSQVPLLSIIPNPYTDNSNTVSANVNPINNQQLRHPKFNGKDSTVLNTNHRTNMKRSSSNLNVSSNRKTDGASPSRFGKQNKIENPSCDNSNLAKSKEACGSLPSLMEIVQTASEAQKHVKEENTPRFVETIPNQLYRTHQQQQQQPQKKIIPAVDKTFSKTYKGNNYNRAPPSTHEGKANLKSQTRQSPFVPRTTPAKGNYCANSVANETPSAAGGSMQVFKLLSAKRLLNVVNPSNGHSRNEELQNQAVAIHQNYHGSSKLSIDGHEFSVTFWFSLRMAKSNVWTPDLLKICFPKISVGNPFDSYGNCFVKIKFIDDRDNAIRHLSYEFKAESGSCTKPQLMHLNCSEATYVQDSFYDCELEMKNFKVDKNTIQPVVMPALGTACKIEIELFIMTRVTSSIPNYSKRLQLKHREIFEDFMSKSNEKKHTICRKIHFKVMGSEKDDDVIWGDTCLISAYTPVFEIMCQKSWEESKQPDVLLPNVSRQVMEEFINFTQGLPIATKTAETGSASADESNTILTVQLLEFALEYFIPDLAQICYDKLSA